MRKPLHQSIIHKIREKTPLNLRQKIGPVLSRIIYITNIYFRKNRKRPHVLSIERTIKHVRENELSVIRFGDGEITMLDGGSIGFQKHDPTLVSRLEAIIQTKNPKLLICVPGIWERLDSMEPFAYKFNMHHLYRHGHVWKGLLSYGETYGDTNMTRPYLAYKNKAECGKTFKSLFSIWKNKNVLLIEGAKSRLGVGNDMFDDVASIKRLLCPPENAYSRIDEIKAAAISSADKDTIILLSLGPAAKVLAYELFLLGYRVLDIGHIDMEYEMFLRRESKQTAVPYKYFNEIHERNPEECPDPKYLSQIVATIE